MPVTERLREFSGISAVRFEDRARWVESMPRYFFHARHAGELLVDEQGVELADLSSAREYLLEALVESGVELLPDWQIEITDEAGVLQMIVSLSDLSRQH